MIIGIGIDAVETERFAFWYTKSISSLKRVFSDEEIIYCLQDIKRSAERFAVRFAAREAFYKALSPDIQKVSFFAIMRAVKIKKLEKGKAYLSIDWEGLSIVDPAVVSSVWHLTLTHTKGMAIALVLGESSSGSTKLI